VSCECEEHRGNPPARAAPPTPFGPYPAPGRVPRGRPRPRVGEARPGRCPESWGRCPGDEPVCVHKFVPIKPGGSRHDLAHRRGWAKRAATEFRSSHLGVGPCGGGDLRRRRQGLVSAGASAEQHPATAAARSRPEAATCRRRLSPCIRRSSCGAQSLHGGGAGAAGAGPHPENLTEILSSTTKRRRQPSPTPAGSCIRRSSCGAASCHGGGTKAAGRRRLAADGRVRLCAGTPAEHSLSVAAAQKTPEQGPTLKNLKEILSPTTEAPIGERAGGQEPARLHPPSLPVGAGRAQRDGFGKERGGAS
jgi:hypothetical protein